MESHVNISRHRNNVRWIAVIDSCIALFMVALLGYVLVEQPNLLNSPVTAVCAIYTLQFFMAQILMTSTLHDDRIVAYSRCQKWYKFSWYLYLLLALEFLFVFSARNSYYVIVLMKIIFRMAANHQVQMFMADLRNPFTQYAPVVTPNFIQNFNPIIIPTIGTIGVVSPQQHQPQPNPRTSSFVADYLDTNNLPAYEPPPSYEESMKNSRAVQV